MWLERQIFFLNRFKMLEVNLSGGINKLLTEKLDDISHFLPNPNAVRFQQM